MSSPLNPQRGTARAWDPKPLNPNLKPSEGITKPAEVLNILRFMAQSSAGSQKASQVMDVLARKGRLTKPPRGHFLWCAGFWVLTLSPTTLHPLGRILKPKPGRIHELTLGALDGPELQTESQ